MRPIGVIRSPYGQKFGVPRQAGLVPAEAVLELDTSVIAPDAVRGLDRFSHVWVLFLFDRATAEKAVVRPPRLGGAKKMGVLASRSPHRPNRIGMSAVELVRVEGARVVVRGGDFLDGTPLLDVKPYLPYADAIPTATAGWAEAPLPRLEVRWAADVQWWRDLEPALARVVEEALALDPRRAGAREGSYAMRVGRWDVKCVIRAGAWEVVGVVEV
ncbi:MAG: tRNA (N6-threonylcarbamoyladenosine(37)-N6)-methyltransferase TrmO [Myxococcota bacterium]